MKYTKEQLEGNIFKQGDSKYIIEYINDNELQFYKEEEKSYKYKGYNTESLNKFIKDGNGYLIIIKPLEHTYECY